MEEEKKFGKMNIGEIEGKIRKLSLMSKENQFEMYRYLEYLRMSERYKENPQYKKSSFWQYVQDMFNILQNTYRENVFAFFKFPEHTKQYGVGLITKIQRECGKLKVDTVIAEIKKEAELRKKPFPRNKIDEVILRYRSPDKKKPEKVDWKALYEHERIAHENTKKALKDAMMRIKELNEQIAKLKESAKKLHQIKTFIKEEIPRKQQQVIV
jgi:hypothetical protein